jgi:hypothetical protein
MQQLIDRLTEMLGRYRKPYAREIGDRDWLTVSEAIEALKTCRDEHQEKGK